MRSRAEINQIGLIIAGVLVTALFGVFFYRELFPEYKIYQEDYAALEQFRETYTHESAPVFKFGVKQIVLERDDKGPPVVDRCISCHVALQIPAFSPTKIGHDINGNVVRDEQGHPVLVTNPDYIWGKLDQKIIELRDEKVNEQLKNSGNEGEIRGRLAKAKEYEALKTVQVGHHVYDVTKVLAMHPLMGKETRPFEYHPIEEYGCTSCHNGNGKGLTTDKAHGPVFDKEYEAEAEGPMPQFTEADPDNDPRFAHAFNDKPGNELLFQTTPLFIGSLIQAKCMQCHQTSQMQLETVSQSTSQLAQRKQKQFESIKNSYEKDKQTFITLLEVGREITKEGYAKTIASLKQRESDYNLPIEEMDQIASQLKFLQAYAKESEEMARKKSLESIDQQLAFLLGSPRLVKTAQKDYAQHGTKDINEFLKSYQSDPSAKGTLFVKGETLDYQQDLLRHAEETQQSFQSAAKNQKVISSLVTDVDELTRNYQRGKELYLSQACYACHRISNLARGGVGPELTRIGDSYPWYIKQSIVWPQADLASSTMPNMRLDHEELEDLMAFLLAQKGGNRAVAQSAYQASLQSWEGGRKLPWEKPVAPAQMHDVRYAMKIFTMEGCASCHRLQGFESNVGFKVEKQNSDFDELYAQQQWFKRLFPETIRVAEYDEPLPGSLIVAQIEKHTQDIDARLISDVRQGSIIEEIEQEHPGAIEALYSNFKYALRAKNTYFTNLILNEKDPGKRALLEQEQLAWKERVHRVLMMFIQQYGLGRLIGPQPTWSGIYRSDEWLMEHFRNPSAHVPRSIMPVMPFDDTKFYALTHMLDVLGPRNRDVTRQIWRQRGFDPAQAFEMHCSQCHGKGLGGNGPIAQWIYPLPKNLHNSDFLRNLTKERAIYSITHGVQGTPMAPWGEIAGDKPDDIKKLVHGQPVLTKAEINRLVDWLFSSLSGGEVIKDSQDVPKWEYDAQDVLQELKKEGGHLQSLPKQEVEKIPQKDKLPELELPQENVPPPKEESVISLFPTGEGYYAAIRPEVYPRTTPKNVVQEYKVDEVFDVIPNDKGGPDQESYYIKHKYYTPYNLQEGQKFFLINCAVCHGNEGDGSGSRAGAMIEAKPRMLTNLDWIHSRDDLRLLRSIKFGVLGTAMTPWGDLTNALQRMQLVMFIRNLSRDQDRRDQLDKALFKAFETAQITLEEARIVGNTRIQENQKQQAILKEQQSKLEFNANQGKISSEEALKTYQKNLELAQRIADLQLKDNQLIALKNEVKKEREMYANLGISLISKDVEDDLLHSFFEMVRLHAGHYQLKESHLIYHSNPQAAEQIRELRDHILENIQSKISDLGQKKKAIEATSSSAQTKEELSTIQADLNAYDKIKSKLMIGTEEALRSEEKQKKIITELNQE